MVQMNTKNMLGLSALVVACCGLISGCASSNKDALVAPQPTIAPYETNGDILWAVVPLRNESGASQVDVGAISDQVVAAAEEVRGIRALPLNRTLEAMRAQRMSAVRTPGEARQLANAMGVDGIIVGTITAYDPYTPTIGLSLALFARPGSPVDRSMKRIDPKTLQASATDTTPTSGSIYLDQPMATASELLDAKNNGVLMELKSYAEGRSDPNSALGWRRYTASMMLYSEFAAHKAVDSLVQSEWIRAAGVDPGRTSDR